MKKKKSILLAILLMAVGFAAVTTNLIINGSTSINANNADFKVLFTKAVLDDVENNSLITDDTHIVFDTKELKNVGDKSVLVYTIKNNSRNYDADITMSFSPETTEYIRVTNVLDSNSLAAGEETDGTLTIELIKGYVGETTLEESVSVEIEATAKERTELAVVDDEPEEPEENPNKLLITDKSNNPIPNAVVTISKDTDSVSAVTDNNGYALLNAKDVLLDSSYKNVRIKQTGLEDLYCGNISLDNPDCDSFNISRSTDIHSLPYNIMKDSGRGGSENDYYYYFTGRNSNIYYSNVRNLYTLDYIDIPEEAIYSADVSRNQNGSVMSWIVPIEGNEDYYNLYIGSPGGVIAPVDAEYLFYNSGFKSIDLSHFSMPYTENATGMFQGTTGLTTLDGPNQRAYNLQNMDYMFQTAGDYYNGDYVNVSIFSSPSVTSMKYTFNGVQFKHVDLTGLKTSKVTDMTDLFKNANKVEEIIGMEYLDTRNITNMDNMFWNMYRLQAFDATHLNTKKVTSMNHTFCGLELIPEFDASHLDTRNVTSMKYTFANLKSVKSLDLSHLNTSKVTDMEGMVQRLGRALSGDDLTNLTLNINGIDTSKVTNMKSMFDEAHMSTLNLSDWDTSSLVNMNMMFDSCYNLRTLYLNNADLSKVEDTYFFSRDQNLVIYAGANAISILSQDIANNFSDRNITVVLANE